LGHVFASDGFLAGVRRGLVSNAYRLALRGGGSRVIFQNSDDMSLFVKKGIIAYDKARLIRGSGVDLEKYRVLPEPCGRVAIALVSRMLWSKGIGEFVRAAGLLRSEGLDARFVLVGDVDKSNPDSISTNQLSKWSESGVVEWNGWVDDIVDVYESAHIVCLPSRYGEGVPRSLIEAAACGRPIVTTDAPGCREIVRDGENGILVPVGDELSLAYALRRLIADGDLRQRMGERGRSIVESEFSLKRVIDETLAVYEELLL